MPWPLTFLEATGKGVELFFIDGDVDGAHGKVIIHCDPNAPEHPTNIRMEGEFSRANMVFASPFGCPQTTSSSTL